MGSVLPWVIIAGPTALLAAGLVPSGWSNRHTFAMRRLVMAVTSGNLLTVLVSISGYVTVGLIDVRLLVVPGLPVGLGVYFDSLSAVMMLLISFIGCIITLYSIRYLDGEPTQGRFMRWMSFTLGAVLYLVVSCNLIMFTVAWMLTSFGLHQLLVHYGDRPAAMLAARKKFLISRLGDLFLIAALLLTYFVFGSFEYNEIFAGAEQLRISSSESRWTSLISVLFVLGAMTKSAQFPMHSWLPDTMETPTPVSALMHAGIINAGGFLVIRLSPLISLSLVALDFLAVVGAWTAIFGAIVALTQTSVKRSLAYSTIAQMGFMMLQCGLGAFSAALLHIVAHSLYKAHAFLSSGSIIELEARSSINKLPRLDAFGTAVTFLAGLLVAALFCLLVPWALAVDLSGKPGSLVLGMILMIGLFQMAFSAFQMKHLNVAAMGVIATAAVCASYYISYAIFDTLLLKSRSHSIVASSQFDTFLIVLLGIAFLATFALQFAVHRFEKLPLVMSLYVHASNGFYIDVVAQKLVVRLWG